jgi:hypothetical protein
MPGGSFALVEELFARGEAMFVAELRKVCDADRLGKFAAKWFADPRPAARQFLLQYLNLPLNVYRHEALVKRLFKLAEKANDDELMGAFLVAFDRSVRRVRRKRNRNRWENLANMTVAQQRLGEWEKEGFQGQVMNYSGRFYVTASKTEEVVVLQVNPMPRGKEWWKDGLPPDYVREAYAKRFILFSIPTRRYLRRRAWRYFRKIGKTNPERYRAAAVKYLKRYTDGDVDSDIHLLDNWGLVHTLFYHSPALIKPARGWDFAEGRSLAYLTPAPRFPDVWQASPASLFELLIEAPCRTVRQWAARLLAADHADWLARQPIASILKLIDHADPDVSLLGFQLLDRRDDLETIPVESWLKRLESDDLDRLEQLTAFLGRRLDPARVALSDAVRMASHRSLPVARLGLTMLRGGRSFSESDLPILLSLTQAECQTLRLELAHWLHESLLRIGATRAEWLLEFLDSKHAEIRSVGWNCFQESPLRDEPAIWQKLLESPYDDIRSLLVADLAERVKDASRDLVQFLWASVLLNIHRGSRYKPGIVSQVASRLAEHPDEADRLLPLLAIAVRSLRGPEFRAGLAGVVSLFEERSDLRPVIARQFPELTC